MSIALRLTLAGALVTSLTVVGIAPAHSHPLQTATMPVMERTVEEHSGRIEALEIDDRVRQRVFQFPQLRAADGTVISLHGAMTEQLRRGDVVTLTGVRNGIALEVQSIERMDSVDSSAPFVNTVELEGTLRIAHADYFDVGKGEFRYELVDDYGNVTPLAVATLPSVLHGSMRIKVEGIATRDAASLIPQRIAVVADPPSDEPSSARLDAKTTTVHRVLVVMANFSNTVAPAYTATQVQQVMVTNANSVANYYNEVSYGQHQLNVTVTSSWLTMAYAKPSSCIDEDLGGFTTAANNAAAAAGYAPSNYEYVVYLFPGGSGCGWSGLAYVGAPKYAYINGQGSFVTQVVAHEMGHNFGLLHAGSLRCTGAVIDGTCSAAEYGDPYSTMGNQHAGHFNAVQKSYLGWIAPSTVHTHASGTATYTLNPLESGGGSLYAVKIPTPSATRTYWLEYRQPVGFDGMWTGWNGNGVQIRLESPFDTYCSGCSNWSDDTELLDATPGTSGYTDAAFAVGTSFTDPDYPITVNVTSATPTALSVQVISPGSATSTTTTLSTSANPATQGSSATFTASVTGSSPTGTVAFTDNGASIGGCAAVALAGSGNSRTAQCTTSALTAGTHTIGASYGGDATNQASSGTYVQQVAASSGSINAALASNGAVATASSSYGSGFPVSAINDGDHKGINWGNGGGWADATNSAYPDWVQLNFNSQKTIDHVVVYTVQDSWASPAEPSDAMTFTTWGVTAFQVQAWNGSAWYTVGTVTGNNRVKRTVNFSPVTTDRIRISVTASMNAYSRITEVEAWTVNTTNVAAAANGGVASASSTYSASFPVSAVNNGNRTGQNWGSNGGWADATSNTWPDWVQINFNGQKTIDQVVVYTVQDNWAGPVEPSDTMTFASFGVTDFQVQAWNGSAWYSVATVTSNNLVKRWVTFSPVTTDRIRVKVTGALGGYSRITEIEAWTSSTTNVAASGNGGVASASSSYGGAYPVSAINNGERAGAGWGSGGGWADATNNAYPDWVQVTFSGQQTIDQVVVYTVQDNWASPVEPDDTSTFASWGVSGFQVQAWNGSAWNTVATVTGNNLVKRQVMFPSVTTDRVRVNVTSALGGYSRITELEAWTAP